MNKDIAVSVQSIKKDFVLPHHKNDSIKSSIVKIFEKKDKEVDIFHALRGISFDIKKGEFFGILGRNGSGKSTLLKIISEIYRPTSGKVNHKGTLVSFIELGVGFKSELSGRENVYLNGALLGFSKKEIDDRYNEIVAFAELEEFMEQKIKNYSSGMKVRLAFAVAIQAKSDILVLDEVLAVGDAEFQRKCYEYFKSLKNDKSKTIIFVTHSMGAVREYCDRAVLINEGKIVEEGEADHVADEYLKLFNKSTKNEDPKLNNDRWGSRDVYIDNIDVDIKSENVNITVDLQAGDKAVEDVKFGFRIRDQQNKVLAGANNLNAIDAKIMNFDAHEKKQLHFTMPNILGNQTYNLCATVNLSDGVTTYDNWENIITFSNTRSDVYYPILCPVKLIINESK